MLPNTPNNPLFVRTTSSFFPHLPPPPLTTFFLSLGVWEEEGGQQLARSMRVFLRIQTQCAAVWTFSFHTQKATYLRIIISLGASNQTGNYLSFFSFCTSISVVFFFFFSLFLHNRHSFS